MKKRNPNFQVCYVIVSYGFDAKVLGQTIHWNEAVRTANNIRRSGVLCDIYKKTRG